MIRSMTGFGRAQVATAHVIVSVEARSVNHRHLDIALKLPRSLVALEPDARRLIQGSLDRGRVDVTVSVNPLPGEPDQRVAVDAAVAHAYVDAARRLSGELTLDGPPSLQWILDRPGVLRVEDPAPVDDASAWPFLEAALTKAMAELVSRREAEGEALATDLRRLHEALVAEAEQMRARAPLALAKQQARFRERLTALLGAHPVDEARVLTEVAIWADKADLSEELTRLSAHLEQAALLLKDGGAVGRPLDFLIQEMNREVNTIASKADDLSLAQSVLTAKGLLEKMREQTQNLE